MGMAQANDWDHVRRHKFAADAPPADWPPHIKPISIEGTGLFGIDPSTGDLYWDGRKVETTRRLANFERILATVGAAGALLAGIHPFGHSFGFW